MLAAALLAAPLHARAAPRAIWVWEAETQEMLEDPDAAAHAIAFLRAKKIDRVYLYADFHQDRLAGALRAELYAPLVRHLRAQGISPYALLGSWYLPGEHYLLPKNVEAALATFRRVLEYNARVPAEARFDGVNIDLEPHLLPDWEANPHALLRAFLDFSQGVMDLKRALDAKLPVGPAIPFWLDGITLAWRGSEKPASEHVLDVYDYAALMDYRDQAEGPDGMIELARSEMAYARRAGKWLVIGVEVSPNTVPKVSFDNLREPHLERELAATARAFRDNAAFGGFVIHELGSYRSWLDVRGGRRGPPR